MCPRAWPGCGSWGGRSLCTALTKAGRAEKQGWRGITGSSLTSPSDEGPEDRRGNRATVCQDVRQLRAPAAVSVDPGSILRTHTSIPRDPAPSSEPKGPQGPTHMVHRQTFRQATHTHKIAITTATIIIFSHRGGEATDSVPHFVASLAGGLGKKGTAEGGATKKP